MLIALETGVPEIGEGAWVASTAHLVGSVSIGEGVSIWYGCVLRGDNETISIGPRSNVQDNAVLHSDPSRPITLGEGVSVGHGAVVHGATIGDNVLVGMAATILNGASIGSDTLIAANALVTENMVIPPRSLVAGVPAKVKRELTDAEIGKLQENAEYYEQQRELHRGAMVIG